MLSGLQITFYTKQTHKKIYNLSNKTHQNIVKNQQSQLQQIQEFLPKSIRSPIED